MFQFPLKTNKQTNKQNKTKQNKKKKKSFVSIITYISIITFIYIYICWVQVTPGVTLNNVTPLNIIGG